MGISIRRTESGHGGTIATVGAVVVEDVIVAVVVSDCGDSHRSIACPCRLDSGVIKKAKEEGESGWEKERTRREQHFRDSRGFR